MYDTFDAEAPRRKRKINCKSVAIWTSIIACLVLVLYVGTLATSRPHTPLALGSSYEVADEDEDGKVSPEELENMIDDVMNKERAHRPGQMVMMIQGAVPNAAQTCDMDGNGHIDKHEAEQIMGMMPQIIAGAMMNAGGMPGMPGMPPPGMAGGMVPAVPTDHPEFMEIQNRVKNEFKDAVLDLALKGNKDANVTKEECFGNCFSRCRWMLDPQTCVDTCNTGCGTDAEMFDPMEHMRRHHQKEDIKFGESETNYTMMLKKPGIKAKDLVVETRGPVLVVRGKSMEAHKHYNITHQFFHSVRLPEDVNVPEVSSALENDVLTVTLPKDPKLTAKLKEEYRQLEQRQQAEIAATASH